MKNSRLFIHWLIAFLGLSLFLSTIGCEDKSEVVDPYLDLEQDTLVCKQTASVQVVAVKCNQTWSARVMEGVTWCTVQVLDDQLEIDITENTGDAIREADIEVFAGSLKKQLHVRQLGQSPDILLSVSRLDLNYTDTIVDVSIVSNVEYDVVIPDTIDWIESVPDMRSAMKESTESFHIKENASDASRFTQIIFKASSSLERTLLVVQSCRDKTYEPEDPSGVGDILIPIASGIADQEQPGEGIVYSYDGDPSTIYHSPWYSTRMPVTLEYSFETPQLMDYMQYYPRTDGSNNGPFGEIEIWVAGEDLNYRSVGTFDFKKSKQPSRAVFAEPQEKVKNVRVVVKTAGNDLVSCSEIEFYRKGGDIVGLEEVFADALYSELKAGVTQREIDGIENTFFRSIAQSLYDQTYDTIYRVQEYQPYRPIEDLQTELKTSGYCPFENATGIHFEKGQEAVIIVGPTEGETISLNVYDFDATRRGESNVANISVPLYEGINTVRLSAGGLAYINYFTQNYETAKNIKIHIPSGTVNGYFDKNKHKVSDWQTILSNMTYGCIDIKGDFINLVYGVQSLKTYCSDGWKLIDDYDQLVTLEQDLMGLMKYNRRPKNHMFARVVNSGLFADGWGAGFAEDCMNELANSDIAITDGVWAIAHELGHVNQIRPGLKWQGTTEVTNNVYSICARYKYNRNYMNLEQERCNDGDNNYVLGGRFNSYLNYGIIKGEQWLCQRGQDKMENYQNGGDHFVKLCPLWQLLLYYREIKGQRDWYGDVAEIVRRTDETNLSNGELQLNFIRNTCDVLQQDLSDFFTKVGMLKPIDKDIDDYSAGRLTITQTECDEMANYLSRYPKPETPVLYYLSANSEKAFKEKLSVIGTYNEGVQIASNQTARIDHEIWQNVVVFETYQGEELIKAAIVGTDSQDLDYTLVRYPEGATRIEAVAWDGTRTLVYGKR